MYAKRVGALVFIFLAALIGCLVQLFRLQIVHGDEYRELARAGRVWDELTPSPRGRIIDAGGVPLAQDEPSYGLAVVMARFPLEHVRVPDVREMLSALDGDERRALREALLARLAGREAAVRALASLTGWPAETVARGVLGATERAARYGTERVPEEIGYGLERDAWLRLRVLLNSASPSREAGDGRATRPRRRAGDRDALIPGVRCVWRASRRYPAGATACHVVGHVGEYGPRELESLRDQGRLVAGSSSRLAALRRASDRPETRSAFEKALGRLPAAAEAGGPAGLGRAAAVSGSLRALPEEALSRLAALAGPDWAPIGSWISRPDLVELTEGERVWIRSRGHLEDRRVGRMGVERRWNERLRGRHGYRVVMRNLAMEGGRPVPELDYLRAERPRPGEDLELEIDSRLQRAVEAELARTGLPSAAVFLDPRTGAVRAMASRPAFDPNVFSSGDAEEIRAVLDDPEKPLLNRATQGTYPPGSVFKAFAAAAALEEGALGPGTELECRHEYRVGGRILRCEARPGHGRIGVVRALAESCNIFFYQAAERLGPERLLRWVRAFGLGVRTGVDLPGEVRGAVPPPRARLSRITVVQLGIGQGPLAVTPLQVAQGFAGIATGGRVYRPRLARGEAEPARVFAISGATRALLLAGLEGVCHDPRGTAYRAFNEPMEVGERSFAGSFPGLRVAAKTGTAEHAGGPPHAWFAGFCPADEPEIAFAVLVEGAGHGGDVAAPACARMLAAYFDGAATTSVFAVPGSLAFLPACRDAARGAGRASWR
jgi:cell division protein FtsI/penicillin-binding protein 2